MPYKDPAQRREQHRRWRRNNPEKFKISQLKWKAANPDKMKAQWERANARRPLAVRKRQSRGAHLKRYGLTVDQWNEIFVDQGECCAACFTIDPGCKLGWQTDHDHSTGRVRGILCYRCNVALGYLEDKPRNAALTAYLEARQWPNQR